MDRSLIAGCPTRRDGSYPCPRDHARQAVGPFLPKAYFKSDVRPCSPGLTGCTGQPGRFLGVAGPSVYNRAAAMSSSPQASTRELYLRLLGSVRPYWRVFAISIVTMALAAATEPVLPALMKPLLDGSFVERNQTHPYLVPLAIIGIFFVRGALGFLSSYTLAWVSNKVVLDLRNAMFARLLVLPTRYY